MVSITYGHGYLQDFTSDSFLFTGSSTYTTSGDGNVGGTTTVDASLTQADDYWNGCYIKYLTGDNAGEIREITDFDDGTDTLTHDAFTNQTSNGDTFLLSAWKIVEDGQTLSTPSTVEGDYLALEATGSAGNKSSYLVNFTNIGISTTTYTRLLIRFHTSGSVKTKITVEYSDASTDDYISGSSSSTPYTTSVALDTAKILDHIRIYSLDNTGTVYIDCLLAYKAAFTLPNGAYGINGTIPNRNIHLDIPSRQSTITQQLGSGDFTVNIGCDLTNGDWTRTGDNINGEVFYDILHNAPDEPWQWLDTEREQMKVTLDPVTFIREATGTTLTDRMNLTFREYRESTADNSHETYETRWGTDL
jgi:hypothetical protein